MVWRSDVYFMLSAEMLLDALQDEIRTYWKVTRDAFPSTPSTVGPPTFLDVMHAYSLVTSRAFQVDAYHGAAMVPLADIFNHREDNHVCFEVSVASVFFDSSDNRV